MRITIASLLLAAISHSISAVCGMAIPSEASVEVRSANTCADPTKTELYFEGYSPSSTAHVLQRLFAFVSTDTVTHGDWQVQGQVVFQAWSMPQEFTVPLWAMYNPTTIDYSYVIATDGTTPSVAGLQALGPVAYVYATQVCGSIPLFALAQGTEGDHWYTTVETERDGFVSLGWVNEGIVAFVLPVNS
ncbi:hypothetical protein CVT26_012356 [Gymnopilus dilepis]|uniref:DUF5648 domain-containing protein n=1 Tax=Gymnopilus dilepis TaxID=231916 RepID=A0A409WDD0_9AGAR|nr:hypothetical protein CVT26_012356 [Gymnopilus dilepis]